MDIPVIAPSGEAGTVPEEKLQDALANGFTQPTAPTAESLPEVQQNIKSEDIGTEAGTYNVVTPTGDAGTVPTEALPSALQNGFLLKSQHAAKTDFEGRVNYWKKELTNGIAGGHIETALRGFGNEFLAGGADKLETWLGQSAEQRADPEVQLENKAREEAQRQINEEQSTTYKGGEVGGFLGQAYLGGQLAKAAAPLTGLATKGIANPLLKAAADEAIAGAITVSPQAMAQAAINKDPMAAAESLLIGIGTGAVIGSAIKLGGRYLERKATELAAEQATKVAGEAEHRVTLNVGGLEPSEAEAPINIGKPPAVNVEQGLGTAGPPAKDIFERIPRAKWQNGPFVPENQYRMNPEGPTQEPLYYRTQPKGVDEIMGHTSRMGGEPLDPGHVFAYDHPDKIFDGTVWNVVKRTLKKDPEAYNMLEMTAEHVYHPVAKGDIPYETEGVGVKPKEIVRKIKFIDWLNERANLAENPEHRELAEKGLEELGIKKTPLETGPEAVPSSINLASGKVGINPEAFEGKNYTPESNPIFNIRNVKLNPESNDPLEPSERLFLEHLGLTTAMRKNIGDAGDQRRILRILAEKFGDGDADKGLKILATTNKTELALKLKALTEENGPMIGQIRKELDRAIEQRPDLKIPIVTEDLKDKLIKLKDSLVSPEEKAVVDHMGKFLADKYGDGAAYSPNYKNFTEADKVKTYFQDRVDWRASGADKAPNRVAAQIARIMREHVEENASKIASETQNAKIIKDWANFKTLYGVGKTLENAAENTLNAPITHEFIPGGHGALGAGALGHIVGTAIGTPILGPIVGITGSKLLKHYLRDGGIAKAAYYLGGRIKDPAVHSLVAVDAIRSISEKLDDIPRAIKSFVEAGAARLATSKGPDPIKEALGEEANGLSKEQQFERLAERVNFAKANPEASLHNVSELVEGVAIHHPQLASDLTEAMQKKLEYLYTILPKNPSQPMPFQHNPDWKPSEAQVNEFKKQLAVANDPFRVIDELKSGTLSSSQVATLAVINPDILAKMRSELIKISMNKQIKLNYQQRLTMGIMLGEKIDAGLLAIPALQSAMNPQAAPAAPPAKKGGGGRQASLKMDKLPDYRTSFQKSVEGLK